VTFTATLTTLVPLLLPSWMDPEHIIRALGNGALWGVAAIIFIECCIFPILPGDSLLFAVGMFTAMGTVHYGATRLTTMVVVILVLIACSILGNFTGYWLGRIIGPPLFKPRDHGLAAKIFNPVYVDKTHEFFKKYGSRALILARFVPWVRTFVTLIAGVGKMHVRPFMVYTAIGGVAWITLMTVAGYFLGTIPLIKNNFEVAVVLIVLLSLVPMAVEYLKHRREKARAAV